MKYLLILFIAFFMCSCNDVIERKAIDIETHYKTIVFFSDSTEFHLFKEGDTIQIYKANHCLQEGDNGLPTRTVVLQ